MITSTSVPDPVNFSLSGRQFLDTHEILQHARDEYRENERPQAAVLAAECAVRLASSALPPEHPVICGSYRMLAFALQSASRFEEALAAFAQELALIERAVGYDHHDTQFPLFNIADLLEQLGRQDQGAEFQRRFETVRDASGSSAPHRDRMVPASVEINMPQQEFQQLCQILREYGQYRLEIDERHDTYACRSFAARLALLRAIFGESEQIVAPLLDLVGAQHRYTGFRRIEMRREASAHLHELLNLRETTCGAGSPDLVPVLLMLAEIESELGNGYTGTRGREAQRNRDRYLRRAEDILLEAATACELAGCDQDCQTLLDRAIEVSNLRQAC